MRKFLVGLGKRAESSSVRKFQNCGSSRMSIEEQHLFYPEKAAQNSLRTMQNEKFTLTEPARVIQP